jgi:hypothetical protein
MPTTSKAERIQFLGIIWTSEAGPGAVSLRSARSDEMWIYTHYWGPETEQHSKQWNSCGSLNTKTFRAMQSAGKIGQR